MAILLQLAEYYLEIDASLHLILDGRTYVKRAQVESLLDFSLQRHWDLRVIYCTCSDELARARLEQDVAVNGHPAANRDFGLYLRLKAESDPLLLPHLRVDTGAPLEDCVTSCMKYLRAL